MNWILYGFKNCGKTTLGKLLAQKYKRKFVDTDHMIEDFYERDTGDAFSASQIFAKEGEFFFRKLEERVIFCLRSMKEGVISLGGGSVLQKKNVSLLEKIGSLIYLNAPEEFLREKCMRAPSALFYQGGEDPLSCFERLFQEREKIYHSLAKREVSITGNWEKDLLSLFFVAEDLLQEGTLVHG